MDHDAGAITVHVYSPPLRAIGYYEVVDLDHSGHRHRPTKQRREAARRCKRRAARALRWLLSSLAALGASALLFFLTGLTGWIAVACAIASAASLAVYALATRQERSAVAM